MESKFLKRICSLAIVVFMVLSMVPTNVFAAEATEETLPEGYCPECKVVHEWVTFDAATHLDENRYLTPGYYKLGANVTLTASNSYQADGTTRDASVSTADIKIAADTKVCLDLAGYDIAVTNYKADTASAVGRYSRVITNEGTLSILDSVGGGEIKNGRIGSRVPSSYGNGGNILNTGTFNLYSGTITGGIAYARVYNAGALGGNIANEAGSVFNMYGGTVSDGQTYSSSFNYDADDKKAHQGGGNIYSAGEVNISGGTISGGEVAGAYSRSSTGTYGFYSKGGNIFMHTGTFNMTGGTITGGKITRSFTFKNDTNNAKASACCYGGNLYAINTDVAISNATITNGSITPTVKGESNTTSTNAATAYAYGGNIYVKGDDEHTKVTITDSTISGGVANGAAAYADTTVTDNRGKGLKMENIGGNIYLTAVARATIDGNTVISGGSCAGSTATDDKTHTGYGGNIFSNRLIDIKGNAQILNGVANDNPGGNIYLGNYSHCTISENAKVTGGIGNGNSGGGNIYITGVNSTLTIKDNAEVSGGSARGGGNIYANSDSKVYITGGTIKDGISTWDQNELYWAGGNLLTFNGASATITGGTISGGTANRFFHSIGIRGEGTLNVLGGQILGTDAENDLPLIGELSPSSGYGVFVYNGTVAEDPTDFLAPCACYEMGDNGEYKVWHVGMDANLTACTADNCAYKANTKTVDPDNTPDAADKHEYDENGYCTICGIQALVRVDWTDGEKTYYADIIAALQAANGTGATVTALRNTSTKWYTYFETYSTRLHNVTLATENGAQMYDTSVNSGQKVYMEDVTFAPGIDYKMTGYLYAYGDVNIYGTAWINMMTVFGVVNVYGDQGAALTTNRNTWIDRAGSAINVYGKGDGAVVWNANILDTGSYSLTLENASRFYLENAAVSFAGIDLDTAGSGTLELVNSSIEIRNAASSFTGDHSMTVYGQGQVLLKGESTITMVGTLDVGENAKVELSADSTVKTTSADLKNVGVVVAEGFDGCVWYDAETGVYSAKAHDAEDATCTEDGKCTNCNAVVNPATGHTDPLTKYDAKDATCTEAGYKEYYYCAKCEVYFEDAAGETVIADLTAWQAENGDGYIAPLDHDYAEEWSKNDTHHWHACANDAEHKDSYAEHVYVYTSNGVGTCECGAEVACEHTYEYTSNNDATCEADGTKHGVCSNCGNEVDVADEGSKLGHDYGDWIDSGTHHTKVCARGCGIDITESHNHVAGEYVEPAYHVNGYTPYACVCGNSYTVVDEGTQLHNYNQQKVTEDYKATDATCTAAATYYYSCECGLKGTETFSYGEVDKNAHTNLVEEDAKAPTCTDIGWNEYEHCSACGHTTYEELPVDKDNHTNLKQEEAKAPTCTEDGWKAYEHCDACGYSTYEADPKIEHNYTYTSNGDGTHNGVCANNCGIADNGTCDEAGTDGACSKCGYIAKTYVAEVNGTKYETLQAAIDAAVTANGGIVKVLGNITVDETVVVSKATNMQVWLNLNGFTVTGEGNADPVIKNNGFMMITGGTVKSTVSGGTAIESTNMLTTFTGAVFDAGNDGYALVSTGSMCSVSGTFIGKISIDMEKHLSASYGTPIKDGLFSEAPAAEHIGATKVAVLNADGMYELADAVASVGNVGYATLTEAIEAAKNGGTVKLLADVELDSAIVIAKGWNVTIDLAGKTVSRTDASGAAAQAIKNEGNLVIDDSVGGGKVTFKSTTPSSNNSYSTSTIINAGSLTINGGMIENTTASGPSYAIDNAWYTQDVSLTVNDGTIVATAIAVRQVPFSTTYKNVVNINGGTLTGSTAGLQVHNYAASATLSQVNIEGGTFNGTYAFYTSFSNAVNSGNTEINVDGGTFNGYLFLYNGNTGSADEENVFKANVTGGTFNGGVYIYATDAEGGLAYQPAISGGEFATEVYQVMCAEGYIPAYDEETGKYGVEVCTHNYVAEEFEATFEADAYTVYTCVCGSTYTETHAGTKKTAVAEANGTKYETLEEAIAAGGEVKLLSDIEIKTSIKITNTVSVDLNGYTLTGPDDGEANWYAFIVDGGDLTLTDSTGEGQLYAKCYGVETKSGSFTLDGAKIVATKNGTVGTAVVNYGGTVIIKSGYASGASDAVYTGGYFSNASTTILGGTLDGTVTVENWEAKHFTETVSAATNTYTPGEDQKWVEQDGVYVLTDKVYVAEVNGAQYETLAEALAADGEVKLLTDITLTEQVVAVGETIDLNGYTLSGNIAATLKLNGGNLITAEGYKMIGDEAEYYYSADAVITIAPTTTLDITIHSGTLTLVPDLWYTTVGQTLIIEQAATFVIPEGKTMYVNGSTVTATGTIANYGTLLLAEGAHVKGDIAGTFKMAGGTYETSKYVMIGAANGKYLSSDAVFTILPNATMDMVVVSGTITLNDPDWWTFAGQTLTIAEAAKFVVPAGKNINVQSTVIVDGTVQIDGTVTLYNADATIKAVEGLENIVANPAAGDTVIYENGVYKVHSHDYDAVVTAPTCTEKGYTTYTCVCGDSYVADYVDETGHNHVGVYTDPTNTENGYWTYTCHCGDSYVVVDEGTMLHYAVNETTGESYTTVQAALNVAAEGDTVKVLKDTTEENLFVGVGIKLDLNGKKLTVSGSMAAPFSTSHIIDNTNGEGLLVLNGTDYSLNGFNEHLPMWTTEGVRFTAASFREQLTIKDENTAQYAFYLNMDLKNSKLGEILANGSASTGISIRIKVTYTTANGMTAVQYFELTSDMVADYVANSDEKAIALTVTGIKGRADLTFTAEIASTNPNDSKAPVVVIDKVDN